MKKPKPEKLVRAPIYPGGKKALDIYIKNNLKYPEEAITNKVEGMVIVGFDINVFGEVIEAHIKHGIGSGCDEEAIRLVKSLKFEKKVYHGLRVTHHQTMNIIFRLNEAVKIPTTTPQVMKINYRVVPNREND